MSGDMAEPMNAAETGEILLLRTSRKVTRDANRVRQVVTRRHDSTTSPLLSDEMPNRVIQEALPWRDDLLRLFGQATH